MGEGEGGSESNELGWYSVSVGVSYVLHDTFNVETSEKGFRRKDILNIITRNVCSSICEQRAMHS